MQVNSPAEGTGPIGSWEAIFKMAAYMAQRKHLMLATEVKALISIQTNLSSDKKHLRMASVFLGRLLLNKFRETELTPDSELKKVLKLGSGGTHL